MKKDLAQDELQMQRSVRTALRIGFIALLLVLSFAILKPFLAPVAWGIIFAVGIYPLHRRFTGFLRGRAKLSAVLITLLAISIIVVPAVLFTSSTVDSVSNAVTAIEDETLVVPPPAEKVKDWPLIGERTYEFWSGVANNLTGTLQKYAPQLREFAPRLTRAVTGVVTSILLFIVAMIIGGALLLVAKPGKTAADKIFKAFLGDKGEDMTLLSIATIRSVVAGVIGIAVIQTLFISLGMFVIQLPAAGILAIVILLVTIVQIPLIIVTLPLVFYVFSIADTGIAIIFTVWTMIWSLADNVLKPMLLGKGVDVPMLVILLGAIGGMILGGPVGLFVGSVVLALTYRIFTALLEEPEQSSQVSK
jgi:predicted PurR-regulated permease PerM